MDDQQTADVSGTNGPAPTEASTGTGRGRREEPADERLEILRMVETGTITAEEAVSLFDALDRGASASASAAGPARGAAPPPQARKPRVLRVRITESGAPRPTVNVALPLGLIGTALEIAEMHAPQYLGNTKEIRAAIENGAVGHIVDIEDEDERVEVVVE
ncbi:MAG: hypothetical protein AVDCRST_MAG49-2322 [uncultured Thermomicrobiales bacterium]|uniref:YvlB/LiaX N-terminal domain-containing protein n=1 Tax=uncultured Thermomicrobiales bacterium TaxID=1645740 RepID=A0A6J4UY37_9BACT|nr:MAG: hypothetical protein AVDCRST_MAG49-2322 [uncultured Thermomicrobiales bacterium]